jgi:hypothetical protein
MVKQKIKIEGISRREIGKGEDLGIKLKPGLMTKVANEMGYKRVIDIPDSKIDEYARRLVERYGANRAWHMAHIQVIYRMNNPSQAEARRKFEKICESIDKQYDWKRVNGWKTIPVR